MRPDAGRNRPPSPDLEPDMLRIFALTTMFLEWALRPIALAAFTWACVTYARRFGRGE